MAQQFRQCISVEDLRAPRCLIRNCNDSIRIWCNTRKEIYVVLDPNYRTILFRPIVSEIQKKGSWTRGVDANRGSKVSIIDYVFAGLERGPCAVITHGTTHGYSTTPVIDPFHLSHQFALHKFND